MIDYRILDAQVAREIEKLTAFRTAIRALIDSEIALSIPSPVPIPAEPSRIPAEAENGAKPAKKRAEGLARLQRPRVGLTPAQIERAKSRWVNGDDPVAIAKEVGKTSTWCYGAAKAHGWPPRGSKKGKEPQQMRRCSGCGQQTPVKNPRCQQCMENTL